MSAFSKALLLALALGGASTAFAQDNSATLQIPAPNLGVAATQAAAAQQARIKEHLANGAQIQQFSDGVVVTPASALPNGPGQYHSYLKIFYPTNAPGAHNVANVVGGPPFTGYFAETPASLACLYGLRPLTAGCNPETLTSAKNAIGGSRAVGIVDAFHAPNARADLNHYSTQFGLPQTTTANFVIWYCGATLASCNQATPPPHDSGWEGEISLDVQMVHGLAPHAKIILVEAKSASFADIDVATQKAGQLVAAATGGQVSMSFGSKESGSNFVGNKPLYSVNKVVFFASSGDDPSIGYPAVSPNVVAVGGTSVSRNPFNGNLIGESAWYDAGTGVSLYQPRPAYQNALVAQVGTHRAIPDVAAVANPRTGVWVYYQGNWHILGGTSAASPVFAAISNASAHFQPNSLAELAFIYANRTTAGAYFDVTQGICGPHTAYWSKAGWDLCTGNGAPRGVAGK